MDPQPISVPALRRTITDEIFIALGFPPDGWQRKLLWPIVWPPAHQFAKLAAGVDADIEKFGISQAAQRLLKRFVNGLEVSGAQDIPKDGPLLVASNHPGAYDSVTIIGNLPRDDLKVIVSDIPFLHSFHALHRHLIYSSSDTHDRMNALRAMIHHLQDGGSTLIFPSGLVDPDPDVLPGADQALGAWSPSLELILRRVPETKLLVTIVSGVLAPSNFRNPLTRLPKERWRRQKLAEFFQVMQQLFIPHRFDLTPRISFSRPLTEAELRSNNTPPNVLGAIIDQARSLLAAHTAKNESQPDP